MKRESVLTERNASYNEFSHFFTDATTWFQTPVEWLRNCYSLVLEREVSSKQASYVTQTQLTLILTIFPIVSSLLLQGVFLTWFVFSLYKCKKG